MPFGFYLEPVMDQPNVARIFYGPVLLAAEEAGPRTDWRQVRLDAADIGKSITGDRATLRFKAGDAVLKPFYETYGRNSVYLHVTRKERPAGFPWPACRQLPNSERRAHDGEGSWLKGRPSGCSAEACAILRA